MAAIDRRRNNAPNLSSEPIFDDPVDHEMSGIEFKDLQEPRKTFLRTGLITKANGSAYLEKGKIKVICAVHGPRQQSRNATYSPDAKVTCELKYAPFACSSRHGYVRDVHERDLSSRLSGSIIPAIMTHLFPKSEIAIYVTILEEDGYHATLAAALNAMSCAIAHARIECRDIVSAAAITLRDGQIIVDGSDRCEGDINMLMGYLPSYDEMTLLNMDGEMDIATIDRLYGAGVEQAKIMHAIIINALMQE